MANPFLRYLWTSIWLGFGALLGVLLVLWFSNRDELDSGVLILWSLAYLVSGGLLGFIFSVPKIMSENNGNSQIQTDNKLLKAKYQENTNLTQISDWLSKILIGAGLVQLKEIPKYVIKVARIMGSGLTSAKPIQNLNFLTVMCASIIIYFLVWGFISGYLVMKLVLTEQFLNSSNSD